jgi:hypothetical protein
MSEQIKFGDRLFLRGESVFFDNGGNDAVIESRNGTLIIRGNLVVEGDTTTVNSIETVFADPFITLNADFEGSPTENVGIEVNRGDLDWARIFWNETEDYWSLDDKDFHTTGNIVAYNITTTGGVSANVLSDNGVVIIDITGDGSVDIRAGNIDNTVIGATTPVAGYFTTITGDGTDIVNVLTNYTTDDMSEGTTNLYYTDERVDDRFDQLFNAGYSLQSSYDDGLNAYTLNYIAQNVGSGSQIYDTSNTSLSSFRTIVSGNGLNGGNNDLTVSVVGDEIIIDTAIKINQLAFNSFTGIGSLSIYTLPYSVSAEWQILLYIDGVVQEPINSYTVSTNTITLSSPLANGSVMNVIRLATNVSSVSVVNADTLDGQLPSYYLDYNNFSNTPTNHMVTDSNNIVSGNIEPSTDNVYNLGSPSNQWASVYGHSIEATYADLAERYEADAQYDAGTVVILGGDKEITTTTVEGDHRVVGVVSTDPAYLMNSTAGDSTTHPAIALKGRVPCKVVGPVKKGDMLVSSMHAGYAVVSSNPRIGTVIGKAISNYDKNDFGMVEILVSMM